MISITVNDAPLELETPPTISALLQDKGYAGKLVAVAINGQFVPKSQHDSTPITDGDTIEIVAPMQGG